MNDNHNTTLLTVERAIADGLDPASLRWVADKMELLGYGRERSAA